MSHRVVFEGLEIPAPLVSDGRAQLVFEGVEQGGASYEVRVFLNNPQADRETLPSPTEGYVGSFHVYGYGVLPAAGDRPDRPARVRREGEPARAPIRKTVRLGRDVLEAEAGRRLTVTAVAVPYGAGSARDAAVDLSGVEASVAPGPF